MSLSDNSNTTTAPTSESIECDTLLETLSFRYECKMSLAKMAREGGLQSLFSSSLGRAAGVAYQGYEAARGSGSMSNDEIDRWTTMEQVAKRGAAYSADRKTRCAAHNELIAKEEYDKATKDMRTALHEGDRRRAMVASYTALTWTQLGGTFAAELHKEAETGNESNRCWDTLGAWVQRNSDSVQTLKEDFGVELRS